jgi:hypothetical protein
MNISLISEKKRREIVSGSRDRLVSSRFATELGTEPEFFLVRMGRGLKIVVDLKSLNVTRDRIEPPKRGFSGLRWYRDRVSPLVVN